MKMCGSMEKELKKGGKPNNRKRENPEMKTVSHTKMVELKKGSKEMKGYRK